ncbi:MAG TPA: BACON domain-containing carbohydrate-binding protein [Chryseosolibacter sp.]|nr:BACON domain-containing carbohydrate-binding protein [Chryseosolibacter sp.]
MKNLDLFLLSRRYMLFLWLMKCTLGTMAQTETYNWNNVAMGGGGFVSAIIPSTSQANLYYARTDVGGAYRWDASGAKWTPLLDWTSEDELSYSGVESLALDPNASNKVYMLAGISYFNNGKTAILRSEDYGNTFTVVDVSNQFKAHGNGMGRQNGERLQVDPNNGSVLYCGTRWNGLFKSTNSGTTWTRLTSLNVTTTPNENGVAVIALDKSSVANGTTQRIFAGISRTGSNFYRSDNAGQSFTAVSGGPTELMPQRAIVSGGFVYITYGNGAGPHGHWAVPEPFDLGQIWKYEIATGAWTNITPSGFTRPFGGICADPTNPQRLIASTINTWMLQYGNAYGDRFLVTTNGGATWTDIVSRGFTLDPNGVTWINGKAIHWTGSIEFDPFNPTRVMVTSGNGIFVNDNVEATNGIWKFTVNGLEELVPRALESIANGPLLTVVSDYDGFRHPDPFQYAPQFSPQMGTTVGLAYAALNPSKVVRAGSSMYYSTDMAQTWTQCTMNGSNGQVAVSADGNIFLHAPEGSSTTYRSIDNGSSWSAVTGIGISDARPVADPVNASKFYAYDPSSGSVFVSTDGGRSFAASGATLSGGLKVIRAVPGREGELWIPLLGGGLARSLNSGQTFSFIGGVTYCGAVGFGKAPSGSSFPTVYMWGTVNNVRGVYRSTDQGTSWVRVNDDAHEYGGPANGQFVQGDMNVFGRVYMSTAGRGVVVGEASGTTSTLAISPASLQFAASGGSQTVTVTSNVSWTVTSNASWLTVSPLTGTNNGTFLATAASNPGGARTAVITVTGGGLSRTVSASQSGTNNSIIVRARGTAGSERIELRVNNATVATWTLSKTMADYTASGSGEITVHFINDERRRDVQVDYVSIGGIVYQAEQQAMNTGVYQNGTCGGAFSEWLNCNGYIVFGASSGRVGVSPVKLSPDSEPELTAYPNPVTDRLSIRIHRVYPGTTITIFDSTGKTRYQALPDKNEHVVDMTGFSNGLYLLAVNAGSGLRMMKIYKK